MKHISAIFLALCVNGMNCDSELPKLCAEHLFRFSDDCLDELHLSIVLHVMDCLVHFSFHRGNRKKFDFFVLIRS